MASAPTAVAWESSPKSISSSARIDSMLLASSRPSALKSCSVVAISPPKPQRLLPHGSLTGMADITVYHNPACSNSRGTLDLLDDREADVEIIEYLHEHPDRATLERILDSISDPPSALVRHDK